jgi:hypothetical protein
MTQKSGVIRHDGESSWGCPAVVPAAMREEGLDNAAVVTRPALWGPPGVAVATRHAFLDSV